MIVVLAFTDVLFSYSIYFKHFGPQPKMVSNKPKYQQKSRHLQDLEVSTQIYVYYLNYHLLNHAL